MTATVHVDASPHQRQHADAMTAGLRRHGVVVERAGYDSPRPCDVAVVWGWKQPAVIAAAPHVLVMERGHVGDRMVSASCGWDGLARRGRYARARDGARWGKLYGHLLQPWKEAGGDYALLIGQVEGDAALAGLREPLAAWARRQAEALTRLGYKVRFRPHPHVETPERPLGADLAGAALCVTYNSTAGVEAVLAGIPTITLDEGAMAWPVAGHALDEVIRPDREPWAWDLAWTSWTIDEISSGAAWEALREVMEP